MRRIAAQTRAPRVRPAGRQGGMTLVELLVALTVAIIGFAGLLSLYTSVTRANAVAADTSQAVDRASQMLETLGTMSVSEIEALAAYDRIDASGWGPVPYHRGDTEGRRGVEFERYVSARAVHGSPSLVVFEAEVRWRDPRAGEADPPREIRLERVQVRQEPAP